MLKIKRTIAICGTFIFLSAIFMIYLTIDLQVFPAKKTIHQEYQDNKWLHFEDRLKRIENDMNKHDEAVGQIKNALKQIIPSPIIKEEEQEQENLQQEQEMSLSSSSKLKLNLDFMKTCPIQVNNLPNVDVQMLEIYKSLKFDNPDGGVWKQGWKIEVNENSWNKQHKLKVFVIPHSHNDPGWVKTFKQYYETQTKKILDNLVDKLGDDPRRKFIWAEISYFSMWWNEQSEEVKQTIRRYIKSNQLEFVTGGWVMNDEANSHWISTVHQLTVGHQWLQKNLNYTPISGWSIDPFGMSPTQAVLLKEIGLSNMLIQRIHYSIKKQLAMDKSLEFRWRQIWDGTGKTDMFTHMMPFYSYDVPHTCGPDPKICCQFDFRRLPGHGVHCPWRIPPQTITDQNVARRAELLLDQYRKKSQLYRTNVVLVPLGDDFRYDHPTEWDVQYNNYQKLFDYMNSNTHLYVQAQFGTLTDYFKALQQEKSQEDFPVLSGDFFTYADRDDHYWSGYYTSRPYYKRMDRVLLHYIRAAEILLSQIYLTKKEQWINKLGLKDKLSEAEEALSLFQHHDGITGTAADFVVVDYAKILLKALQNTHNIIQFCTNRLLNVANEAQQMLVEEEDEQGELYYKIDDVRHSHDSLEERITITIGLEISTKNVVIYNSLAHNRSEVVTFFISTPSVEVLDFNGKKINCQIAPVFEYGPSMSSSKFQLSFIANVPAFGLTTYSIHAIPDSEIPSETFYSDVKIYNTLMDVQSPNGFNKNIFVAPSAAEFSIQNSKIIASFNKLGLLKAIKIGPTMVPVHLDFAKYGARPGRERSGAYLFLPDGDAVPMKIENTIVKVIQGPIYSSVIVQIPYVDHTVTLYNSPGADSLGLEVQNVVDITKTSNFELVMRLSTGIQSQDEFFTDLNAYQMIRRKRFKKLPLQANYYPMPSALYIEDENLRLTVLTSSPIGCSSLKEGQVEMMMDRRLNQDDNRGLGQPVLDNLPTRHTFKILLEKRLNKNCKGATENHPAGFQTLASHVSSQSLLNPLIKMQQAKDESLLLNINSINNDFINAGIYTPVKPNTVIGVDTNIVSLKPAIFINNREYTGLIIHRNNVDICFAKDDELRQFPIGNGIIDISQILNIHSKHNLISKTSLSFLHIKPTTDKVKEESLVINICPMDVQAYVIH